MTPAQLDHLKLIDAHLERLLAIAEKRTPGEWGYYWGWDLVYSDANGKRKMIADCVDRKESTKQVRDDMAFIASCAGNAEAGWRATRAAIACLLVICDPASGADFTNYGDETFLPQILAAFPLETLNPKQP